MADTGAPGAVRSVSALPATRPAAAFEAERTIRMMGARVRMLRKQQNLTLKSLADRTGVSVSMLSMVERGLASASVGTLVSVSTALGVHMSDLFGPGEEVDRSPVTRAEEQITATTGTGGVHRIAYRDPRAGVELAVRQYVPGGTSAQTPELADGRQVGVLISGELTVELDGEMHVLHPGDSIAYQSSRPHRIVNRGEEPAQALWVSLDS
ncbi:cupin domain-containing protein [Kineosporia sp. J2-2]|uniref:Cupin domain-containing protein n=1 Tax=Kineosporia corallincola TaxID=2835133 RepID=A0ABS5THV6_9ACTN|nr:cupin domain-containing protein [Kineosporia corallincola]MBT0770676.1 cupin domain-containing protein [Kineosporia corallincola]